MNRNLQTRIKYILLAFAALGLSAASSFGQAWQIVDDFQYGGQDTENSGVAVGPDGTLFAAGDAYDGVNYRGLIRASPDNGNSWFLLDDYLYPGPSEINYTIYAGIVSDSAGNIYVAGTAYGDNPVGPFHWLVRRSTDGGATWGVVDDFVPGGLSTHANAITVDQAGNVYVTGIADYGNGTTLWTVRKGIGGANFTTVDTYVNNSTGPQDIYVHPTAGVFVVGDGYLVVMNKNKTTSSYPAWVVRRSTNGGASWSTVDSFQLSSTYPAFASGIGADKLGNIYVVGDGAVPTKLNQPLSYHWLVRKSTNGGNSWSTVDDYQRLGSNSGATRFATDAYGNLFVTGVGNGHWVVRENPGGTGSWATVDDFQYSGSSTSPSAIAANSLGNVFVSGTGGSGHWLVRRR